LSYRVVETSGTIQKCALRFGWERVRNVDFKAVKWPSALGKSGIPPQHHIRVFKPWPKSNWVIVVSISSSDEVSWWVAQYGVQTELALENANDIHILKPIPTESFSSGTLSHLSDAFFTSIERLAMWIVSLQFTLSRLKRLEIPHVVETPITWWNATAIAPLLHLKTSALIRQPPNEASLVSEQLSLTLPRSCEQLRETGEISYIVKGSMRGAADFFKLLSKWPSADAAFSKSGAFALRIQSPLGVPSVVDDLITRLASLCRLQKYLELVKSRNFRCTAVSLDQMTFAYASLSATPDTGAPPILSAKVTFTTSSVIADFFPADINPHTHLRPLLTKLLNPNPPASASVGLTSADTTTSTRAFVDFTLALTSSLPVLRAFTALSGTATVHLREPTTYQLAYARPLCAFSVRYHVQQHHSNSPVPSTRMWCVEEVTTPGGLVKSQRLKAALETFWANEAAQEVVGLKSGVACGVGAIEGILSRLDGLVRGFDGVEEDEVVDSGDGDAAGDVEKAEDERSEVVTSMASSVGLGLSMAPAASAAPAAATAATAATPVPPAVPPPNSRPKQKVDKDRPKIKQAGPEVIMLD